MRKGNTANIDMILISNDKNKIIFLLDEFMFFQVRVTKFIQSMDMKISLETLTSKLSIYFANCMRIEHVCRRL